MGTVSDARKADYAALESRAIDLLNRAAEDLVNWVELIHDSCIPTWLKWDMAPAVPQGDVFGWCIYSAGINICVDMLGIADRISWTGRWRQRDDYDTTPFVEVGKSLLIERVPLGIGLRRQG